MVYVVMGVSGSGKSTVGSLLAKELKLPFYDGDLFHSSANLKKMSAGKALNDEDRWPWLSRINRFARLWNIFDGAVLACSALKQSYRDLLLDNNAEQLIFIYLKLTKEHLLQRHNMRKGHFFPASLLDSQLNTIQEPTSHSLTIFIEENETNEQVVEKIKSQIITPSPSNNLKH